MPENEWVMSMGDPYCLSRRLLFLDPLNKVPLSKTCDYYHQPHPSTQITQAGLERPSLDFGLGLPTHLRPLRARRGKNKCLTLEQDVVERNINTV